MRRINTKNSKKIKENYTPPIKTIKQVVHETGRKRQYIERRKDLNFTAVLANEDSGDIGQKVIIDDDALKAFYAECRKRDGKKGKVPKKKIAKKVDSEEYRDKTSIDNWIGL